MMNIFVVVLVKQSFARHQENLYASFSKDDCIKWVKNWDKTRKTIGYQYPIEKIDGDIEIVFSYKESMKNSIPCFHIWIQKIIR